MSRETVRIKESKFVWKISQVEKFLIELETLKDQDIPDNLDLKSTVKSIHIIGLMCKELPYFQLVIYVELNAVSVNPLINTYDLAKPFQIFLENFDGLSKTVYHMSRRKPRYYSHHIIESNEALQNGIRAVQNIIASSKTQSDVFSRSNEFSEIIRGLPLIRGFGIPTLLSVVSPAGNILPISSHIEQYSGGGVLQYFTIAYTTTPHICTPDLVRQGLEKEIKMFSPNVNVIYDVFGGINLHLFLAGLWTWISYCDITVNHIINDLEGIREMIQNLLNENKESELKKHVAKISQIQGSLASMSMLVENTRFHIMELIDEIADNMGIFGAVEIPIPSKKDHSFFDATLRTGIGHDGHLQNIAKVVRNKFNSFSKKLETADNPVNKMNDFIYNSANYGLQKTISAYTKIGIGLTIAIGILTFFSAKPYLGF